MPTANQSYTAPKAYTKHSGIPAHVDPARRFQHTRDIFQNAKLKAMGNLGIFILQKLDNSTNTGDELASSLKTKWQRVTTNRKRSDLEPTLFKRFEFPDEIYNFNLLENEHDVEVPINKKTGEPITWTPRKLLTWKDPSNKDDKPGRYFTDYVTITFLPSGLEIRIFPARNRSTRKIISQTYNIVLARTTPTSHSSWDVPNQKILKTPPPPLEIPNTKDTGPLAPTSSASIYNNHLNTETKLIEIYPEYTLDPISPPSKSDSISTSPETTEKNPNLSSISECCKQITNTGTDKSNIIKNTLMVYEKFTVSHMLGPQVLNDLNLYNKIKIWTGLPGEELISQFKNSMELAKNTLKSEPFKVNLFSNDFTIRPGITTKGPYLKFTLKHWFHDILNCNMKNSGLMSLPIHEARAINLFIMAMGCIYIRKILPENSCEDEFMKYQGYDYCTNTVKSFTFTSNSDFVYFYTV